MYFIIETEEQLARMSASEECFVALVTNNDNYHPALSTPSLVYYNDGKKGYVLCVKHSESLSIDFSRVKRFVESHSRVYVLDKKFHSYFFDHSVLVDVNFTVLDRTNELSKYDCDALTKKGFYSRFGLYERVNEVVPISKHYESAECLYESVRQFFGLESNLEFYDSYSEAYRYVESQGLKFLSEYAKHFAIGAPSFSESDGLVYSSYNLYNLTGRPTNSFNGLNFLSIPKTEEARSLMVPKNDFFVEFDFDGYHPRLIAELFGAKLSSEPVHLQFGKQYFDKDVLTEEEYQESKRLTFKQLYGSVEPEFQDLPFFQQMVEYTKKQHRRFKSDRVFELPSGRRIRYENEITRTKLFNYVVQNYETYKNVTIINRIRECLRNKKTQLVLVTYDAFLVDFSVRDGQETLARVKEILQEGSMVVKHKHAKSYNFK